MGELNKGARRPADVPASVIKQVEILGAGFMGAGIAYVTASAGMEVVLIDQDQPAADKGKEICKKLISAQVLKGRAKTADKEALLSKIKPTADYRNLAGSDLVIEAVFEDRAVKAAATQRARAGSRARHDLRVEHVHAANYFACASLCRARKLYSEFIFSRRWKRCFSSK